MKYADIFKDKHIDAEHMHKIIKALDEHAGDNSKLKMDICYILADGHETEYTANKKIGSMVQVATIGRDGRLVSGTHSMADYLSLLGITPQVAHTKVSEAYSKAKMKASEMGFTAPPLDANEWDCYASVAMIFSDYWYTVCGDIDKASMIAFEFLSDPDKKR